MILCSFVKHLVLTLLNQVTFSLSSINCRLRQGRLHRSVGPAERDHSSDQKRPNGGRAPADRREGHRRGGCRWRWKAVLFGVRTCDYPSARFYFHLSYSNLGCCCWCCCYVATRLNVLYSF